MCVLKVGVRRQLQFDDNNKPENVHYLLTTFM